MQARPHCASTAAQSRLALAQLDALLAECIANFAAAHPVSAATDRRADRAMASTAAFLVNIPHPCTSADAP